MIDNPHGPASRFRGAARAMVFGALRDARVPLNAIFSVFASAALISVVLVLLIRPKAALVKEDR